MIISPISSFPNEGIQTTPARFDAQAQAVAKARTEERVRGTMLESASVSKATETTTKAGNPLVGSRLDAFA
jgi:hypothetical protein